MADYNHGMTPVKFESELHPTIFSSFDKDLHIIDENESDADTDTLNPLYRAMRSQFPAANAAVKAIELMDKDIPIQIRRERIEALKAEVIKKVNEAMVKPLLDLEDSLRAKEQLLYNSVLQPPTSEIDALRREMRGQEIRRVLREASPGEQGQAMMNAAKRGDKQFLDAITQGPLPIGGPEVLERANELYWKEHVPELGRLTDSNKRILEAAREKARRLPRAISRILI